MADKPQFRLEYQRPGASNITRLKVAWFLLLLTFAVIASLALALDIWLGRRH